MTSEWVLMAESLALGYGPHALFRGLSFQVSRGEVLGIVGPNGCGKTTLLRTLLGLLRPLDGRVKRQPALSVSYVPQREHVDKIVPVTVREVVLMGTAARASALQRVHRAEQDAAGRALALLGIEFLSTKLFRNLSSGQQQRVLLARALATSPTLLVLDEPTFGMDIASEAAVLDLLRRLNRDSGVTILIVTHLLPIVLNLASSIMLMGSRSILHGAVDDVLQEDRLTQLYGVPVRLGVVAGQRTLVVTRGNAGDV